MATKLVVFGLPWDVDSEGLRKYMAKFGPLEDCIVMKDRLSGRSRGFGYVTFSSADDVKVVKEIFAHSLDLTSLIIFFFSSHCKNVLEFKHFLRNRALEVRIATPREEMKPQPQGTKTATRIFVGRIPQSADESMFRRHFEAFGEIIDLYMPKEHGSKGHRGIGFITFQNAESVDSIMQESHELDGTTLHVDRATPKDEDIRHPPSRASQDGGDYGLGYGAYDVYIAAATMFGALGPPTRYDHPGPAYGSKSFDHRGSVYGRGYNGSPQGMGKKIFVGGLPQEANKDDLRNYFGGFGRVADVFIPRDPKGSGHRAFGFVTFSDEGVADKVADKSHEILGCKVTVDIAAPPRGDSSGGFADPMPGVDLHASPYGSMRPFGMFCGNLGYNQGYGPSGGASRSRTDGRHRPYRFGPCLFR